MNMINKTLNAPGPSAPWLYVLAVVPLIIGGLVFAPFYATMVVSPWLPRTFNGPPDAWYYALFFLNFGRDLLFSHLAIYLFLSVGGIVASIIALVWLRPHPVVRMLLVLVLLSILGIPYFYRYQPALVAAPGRAMRVPTQPGFLDGITKTAQAGAEQTPCSYELLGWSATAIFYSETCGNAPALNRSFDPNQPMDISLVAQYIPSDLYKQFARDDEVLDRVRAPGVVPDSAEPSARQVQLKGDAMRSPAYGWVALVARHVYGPEDIVIVQW